MNRAKKSKRPRPQPSRAKASVVADRKSRPPADQPIDQQVQDGNSPGIPQQDAPPKPWVRGVLTIGLLVHLVAVAISFLSVVDPSETHLKILEIVNPYLRATHFGADDRPAYLAYGEPWEQPHRLEVLRRTAGADQGTQTSTSPEGLPQWESVQPNFVAGLAAADRYARWVGTLAELAESDQPGLVAELLLPAVKQMMKDPSKRPIASVRIVRLPTQLTTIVDDALPPPYTANVIVNDQLVDLVRVQESRLNAHSTLGQGTPRPAATEEVSKEAASD